MPTRSRRRAVGPPGARPPQDEPRVSRPEDERRPRPEDDDAWLRADRPPHHDRGV